MRTATIRLAAVIILLGACTPTASPDRGTDPTDSTRGTVAATPTSASRPAASTSTTTTTTATTSTGSTVTPSTTTTVPSTTTVDDPPPGEVTGVGVEIGAGSGEIDVSWDRNPEPDIDHYEVWWSENPGGPETLIALVPHDPGELGGLAQDLGGGRTLFVDVGFRNQMPGHDCYRLRAVDVAGNGAALSSEVCLPDPAPTQVAGLSVELGGGSGEVAVIWRRNAEPDIDHYEIWYSERPGGTTALLVTVPHDPSRLGGITHDLGDGRTLYIDTGRDLVAGTNCYQVAAVDAGGHAGPRSAEVCLQP